MPSSVVHGRYDKRGVGASKNSAVAEADLRFEHFIDDAKQWLLHINETLDTEQVVVIGHSEGALIGSVIANHDSVHKFISIAGAGQPGHEIIREQLKGQPAPVAQVANSIMDSLLQNKPVDEVPSYLNTVFRPSVQPYLMSWFKYSPQEEIAKLNKPVLIVQGTTDIQVSTEQAKFLSSANLGAKHVLIEGMNHVLKSAPMDGVQNMQTYNMPDLPIKDALMDNLVSFIKAK